MTVTNEPAPAARPRRIPLATPVSRQIGSRSARGPIASALIHVVGIAALLYGAQKSADALAAGEGPGAGGGGGGGGNRMVTMILPAPAQAAQPTPIVAPEPDQLVMPREVVPLDSILPPAASTVTPPTAQATGPGSGTGTGPGGGSGSGGGTGGGTGTGTGSGIGPDSGGAGGRVIPPQLITMLIPPENKPASVRGVQYLVRFDVSERGEVLSVQTEPEIRDRGYRNNFLDKMRRYSFAPAHTREGQPVRATIEIRITL